MQRFTKYLAVASLLAMGLTQARADQTNLVQDLTIQLLGLKQGPTTTSRGIVTTSTDVTVLDTRQVINALGAATGSTFSPTARLVLITPLTGEPYSVEVRDGVNAVDVSPYFTYELLSGQLRSSTASLATGRGTASSFAIQRLALADSIFAPLSIHFDLRGTAVSTVRTLPSAAPMYETIIDVAGAGDRNGNLLILNGIIRIRGSALEVVTSGGGGVS